MVEHQVHSNAVAYLPEYGQSDCGLSIWRHPSIFMDVVMWEHRTFASEVFRYGKFTNLTPLSLLIHCKLSFPIVSLKISSLPTLTLKSPNRIFMWYLGNLSNMFQLLIEVVLHIISFIFCWSMNVQNNDMTPATS
jgi:hypothetical protein